MMLEALEFATESTRTGIPTKCMLCEEDFNLEVHLAVFVKHLFDTHHVVVENIQNIANLHEYICYWQEKFRQVPIERMIPSVVLDQSNERFFVLSTLSKEDRELRHRLLLSAMLKVQETERTDENYERECLFCKYHHKGKRSEYLEHLSMEHNVKLGNPQNLVYVDELIEKLNTELLALRCIYCRKTFPDRAILKEHMRKKQHKSVDPKDRTYDKYYSVNYLDPDRTWKSIEKENDHSVQEGNSDAEYDDWNENDLPINCLFCTFTCTDINRVCDHMLAEHRFNFYSATCSLDFYQRVKLINYVRREMHRSTCPFCGTVFEEKSLIREHIEENCHRRTPTLDTFDQPEFYFPTYENDTFLLFLEEIEDE